MYVFKKLAGFEFSPIYQDNKRWNYETMMTVQNVPGSVVWITKQSFYYLEPRSDEENNTCAPSIGVYGIKIVLIKTNPDSSRNTTRLANPLLLFFFGPHTYNLFYFENKSFVFLFPQMPRPLRSRSECHTLSPNQEINPNCFF